MISPGRGSHTGNRESAASTRASLTIWDISTTKGLSRFIKLLPMETDPVESRVLSRLLFLRLGHRGNPE